MRVKTPQCYRWLREIATFKNAFKFSIGNVVETNGIKRIDNLDFSYCPEIVEWLHDSCNYQHQISEDELAEEKGLFKKVARFFLGTESPGKELRAWIETIFKK